MCQIRDIYYLYLLTKRNGFYWNPLCGDLLLGKGGFGEMKRLRDKVDLFNPCRFSSDQTVAGSLTADRVCAQLSSPRVCGASNDFTGRNITY